jgi:oligopeptide transport system permease protein
MWKKILYKSAFGLLTLCATLLLSVFLMLRLPGDPFLQEKNLDKGIHEALLRQNGLDRPILEQSWKTLLAASRFDFGRSYVYREREVSHIIAETFPVSATLGVSAATVAIVGGILWGIASYTSGVRLGLSSLALAIPSFILAALLQYLFAVEWRILPIARWGSWEQMVLPVAALAARPMAFIAKMIRSNLTATDEMNFIIAAKTRRLSYARVLFFHQLPYAFLPLIGYLSQMIATILVGSFIIEKIFSIPGMGYWFVNSVLNRDYPLIIGTTLFFNVLLLLLTFVGDMITLYLDPRQREASA